METLSTRKSRLRLAAPRAAVAIAAVLLASCSAFWPGAYLEELYSSGIDGSVSGLVDLSKAPGGASLGIGTHDGDVYLFFETAVLVYDATTLERVATLSYDPAGTAASLRGFEVYRDCPWSSFVGQDDSLVFFNLEARPAAPLDPEDATSVVFPTGGGAPRIRVLADGQVPDGDTPDYPQFAISGNTVEYRTALATTIGSAVFPSWAFLASGEFDFIANGEDPSVGIQGETVSVVYDRRSVPLSTLRSVSGAHTPTSTVYAATVASGLNPPTMVSAHLAWSPVGSVLPVSDSHAVFDASGAFRRAGVSIQQLNYSEMGSIVATREGFFILKRVTYSSFGDARLVLERRAWGNE